MNAPAYCNEHGGVCEKLGKIEANTEHQCTQLKEQKELLEKIFERQNAAQVSLTEEKAKSKVLYWGIASGAMAAISAVVHLIVRKICGE
jgi:hypothetical protein